MGWGGGGGGVGQTGHYDTWSLLPALSTYIKVDRFFIYLSVPYGLASSPFLEF